MKLLSWNVQGIGTPITKDHFNYICQYYNPDMVFLAETKAPLSRMDLFFRNSNFHDWFIVPSVGIAKGLAIAWHNNITMKLLSSKFDVCHFESKVNDIEILITCVYGSIEVEDKIEQWTYISDIAQQVDKPWILIGDLNFILDPDEKQGGIKQA